ncbi:hypothetical protein AA0114_g2386 [Alternaria tenuissima]|uniref:FAD-binding PCMH-type domain-containing protein n=1 Tax=Alternaria tenuissima TaxID=119927 RepID=A0A4Q4MRP3_9PLEO|nr:hypothetical protein AA0114_g2386 [Alternaria tenuissima]
MVSSFVSALLVASAAARFAPRSAEPPMRLADRQSGKFARIEQTTDGTLPRFDWEQSFLTDTTIEQALDSVPADAKSLFQFASHNIASDVVLDTDSTFNGRECKVFPGDEDWPAEASWSALNDVTNGALMKPLPQAHICYNSTLGGIDRSACDAMTKSWTDPFSQLDDPIEMLSPLYQGSTCQPPQIYNSKQCAQGGYSVYVVNASTTAQIQLALNFARNTGVRFVVRNTGHDFAGKSGGAGSLSVWTHGLKDIAFIENYESDDYSGPAIKAGSGAQGFELYAAARDFGGTVMGGECPTVGAMGGWIQGGGHSPLSGSLGIGADHVLSMEVVMADGRYVITDKNNNPELFWSLRGGGGLTFGVVTSVTVKMHPDQPIASANWLVTTGKNVSTDAFKQGLKAYMKYFPQNADNNTYAYWKVFPSPDSIMMDMSPFFAPGKTVEEAKALVDPWVKDMAALGITVEPKWTQYNGFYDAYNGSFPVEGVNSNGVVTTSRMIPRSNWANESIFDETFEALWGAVDEGMALIGYNMAPSWEKGGRPDNSVNPAWRNMLGFIITGTVLNMTNPAADIIEERLNMTYGVMQKWRDITPGSGSYLSEGDRLEPNFQWSFWGSFYPRLLEAKRKFDPFNLFWATGAVGSEFFNVRSVDGLPNENGKLCVNPKPMLYQAEGPDWVPE